MANDEDVATNRRIEASKGRPGMESAPRKGDSAGGELGGSSFGGSSSGDDPRAIGKDPSSDVDSERDGLGPRVQVSSTLRDPSENLLAAFREGDPEAAHAAALELIAAHHEALREVARLRFKLNLGTAICQSCDGLRAGPDVVATCFDIQQCHFASVKRGKEDPRQLRVIQSILRRVPPKLKRQIRSCKLAGGIHIVERLQVGSVKANRSKPQM